MKEKRFTPNVSGSETFATAKNGRRMLKVKCVSCGITKTRFISGGVSKSGAGHDMRIYAGDRVDDPTNPLYQRGGRGFDIHKAIGKLPKPKKGGRFLVTTTRGRTIPLKNSFLTTPKLERY